MITWLLPPSILFDLMLYDKYGCDPHTGGTVPSWSAGVGAAAARWEEEVGTAAAIPPLSQGSPIRVVRADLGCGGARVLPHLTFTERLLHACFNRAFLAAFEIVVSFFLPPFLPLSLSPFLSSLSACTKHL